MPGYDVPEITELPSTRGDVRDMVLQDLVGIVNRFPPSSFGVTFVAGGTVITGDLISAQEYFERYGQMWRQVLNSAPDVAKKIGDDWTALGARHTEQATGNPTGPYNFAHLRNARVLMASGLYPTSTGLLWRGRISQITGFSIGVLS
jgi:hypothetical protein